MYIDDTVISRVEKLKEEYKQAWGTDVDLSLILNQKGITQEIIEKVLLIVIETGESPLSAYKKCK